MEKRQDKDNVFEEKDKLQIEINNCVEKIKVRSKKTAETTEGKTY